MIDEALKAYLEEEYSDYAIVMNGDWGCGKTYYIRELLKKWENANNFEDIEFVYVSLFGTSSIEDFYKRIYWALHKLEDEIYNKSFAGRFFASYNINLDLSMLKISSQKGNLQIETIGSSISKENIEEKTKSDLIKLVCGEKDRFYIFDDIERISFGTVNIKEIFGAITNLIEQDKAKVLLICNEEKIKKSDDHVYNKSTYFDYKEKFVRHTFDFDPTIEYKGYDIIFEDFIKHFNYLSRFKNDILKVFSKAHKKNLRTLKFIVSTLHKIFMSLTETKEFKDIEIDQTMKLLINFVVIYSVEYKDGKYKKDLDNLGILNNYTSVYLDDVYGSEINNNKNDHIKQIIKCFANEWANYHFVHSISEYISTGILDHDKFKKEITSLNNTYIKNKSMRKSYDYIRYYWKTEDSILQEEVYKFEKFIENGNFNFNEIRYIYSTLMRLKSQGIDINVNDNLFLNECKNRLDKECGYDDNGFTVCSENDKYDKNYNDLIKECRNHNETIKKRIEKGRHELIISSIKSNKIDNLEGFYNEDSHFLLKVDYNNLFESLNEAKNETVAWISNILLEIPMETYKDYEIENFKSNLSIFVDNHKGKIKSILTKKILTKINEPNPV